MKPRYIDGKNTSGNTPHFYLWILLKAVFSISGYNCRFMWSHSPSILMELAFLGNNLRQTLTIPLSPIVESYARFPSFSLFPAFGSESWCHGQSNRETKNWVKLFPKYKANHEIIFRITKELLQITENKRTKEYEQTINRR